MENSIEQEITFEMLEQNELKKICDFFSDILPEEEILKQARENIKRVLLENLKDGYLANYNFETREITISTKLDEDSRKVAMIHEMLHAITNRNSTSKGFKRVNPTDGITRKGIGMDEAITEEMAQRISGIKRDRNYEIERMMLDLFSAAIGEEFFIKDYLLGTNFVEKEMRKQYNEQVLLLYEKANFYVDALTLSGLNECHIKEDDDNYEKQIRVINRSTIVYK